MHVLTIRSLALLACLHAAGAWADNSHQPLPRPDLLPLSTEHLLQIQTLSQSVVTARDNQIPDPHRVALRNALLNLRAEIGATLTTTMTPQPLSSVPCKPSSCGRVLGVASRADNLAGIRAKRDSLSAAALRSSADPTLAHLTNTARKIKQEVDLALQAPPEARTPQLISLYRKLEPRDLQEAQERIPLVLQAPRHTLIHHQPGVRYVGKELVKP